MSDIINKAAITEDIFSHLRDNGFTYLLLRDDLWQQWATKNISADKITVYQQFFSTYTSLQFKHDQYILLKISLPTAR